LLVLPSAVSPIEPDMLTPPNNFCSRRSCAAIFIGGGERLAGAEAGAGIGNTQLRRLLVS